MPESKTIEIDEILTPEKSGDESSADSRARTGSSRGASSGKATDQGGTANENPFADFHKALPWKARITLKLTQWFVLLRSKSWGKFVIIPIIILGLFLAIPVGITLVFFLIIRSLFAPRRY